MTLAVFRMELLLRRRAMLFTGMGLMAVAVITGALFPAFGKTLGDVDLPEGVGDLLGGGDFATIAGWLNTEIVSVYGPLVVAGAGITAAAATIAGEEEDRILALVLAHPVPRARLVLAKAAAIGASLLGLGVLTWVGLLLAVALAGGGIGPGDLAALALHLACLGLAFAALSLALGAATGRRGTAAGGAAAVAVVMFLVNGLAPAIDGLHWLRHLTLFFYYEGKDPLTTGVHLDGLAVLLAVTGVLLVAAVAAFTRRDLRG